MNRLANQKGKVSAALQKGRWKQAIKEARIGLKQFPSEAGFANAAGMASGHSGKPAEAASFFFQAMKLAPQDTSYQDNLVQALIQAGQLDKAETLINQLIVKRSETHLLRHHLGFVHHKRGNQTAAREASDASIAEATARLPDTPAMARMLAQTYNLRALIGLAQGEDHAALEDFRTALRHNPKNATVLSNMAGTLVDLGQADDAYQALDQALTLEPGNPLALERMAILRNTLGQTDRAVATFQQLLQVQPHHASALRELTRIQTGTERAAMIPQLKAAFSACKSAPLDQAQVAFGLGHAYESAPDSGDDVTRWYGRANALAAKARPYDAALSEQNAKAILARFGPDFTPPKGVVAEGPDPVFVLGQPRSGTTMTELVLSAHPDIYGAGELPWAGRLSRPYLETDQPFGADQAQAFAKAYYAALPAFSEPIFVDKMPANYQILGFLGVAFPNAKFVHTDRDPRDVAWSLWRNWFSHAPLNYSFDLAAMAAEANAYRRYMARWQALFGDRILTLRYEDLVRDPETLSQTLAEWLGLDWAAEMARPDQNPSAVRTNSSNQVREKVHTRSVGGWQAQADTLAEFIQRLDPELWPEI